MRERNKVDFPDNIAKDFSNLVQAGDGFGNGAGLISREREEMISSELDDHEMWVEGGGWNMSFA